MIVRPHQLCLVVALCPSVLRRGWSGFDPLPRRLPLQVSPPLGSLLVSLPLLLLQTQLLQLLPEQTHTQILIPLLDMRSKDFTSHTPKHSYYIMYIQLMVDYNLKCQFKGIIAGTILN